MAANVAIGFLADVISESSAIVMAGSSDCVVPPNEEEDEEVDADEEDSTADGAFDKGNSSISGTSLSSFSDNNAAAVRLGVVLPFDAYSRAMLWAV